MGFYDVLKEASDVSGVGLTRIGPALGRDRSYVSGAMSRGSVPSVDNAAAMLAACGYALVALPAADVPPDALVVEPPARDDEAERRALERRRDKLRRELAAVDELIG